MANFSSAIKRNPKVSSSPFDRLPVEILTEIVLLSLLRVDYNPLAIMRRVEELRLVATYWARCIDQCPTFWTHITSQASPARYTQWLEKSQNAPLRVECRADGRFMELLVPHTDRWQSFTFSSSSPDAWVKLTRPAPQLQELNLHYLPNQNPPAELFQGVTPRLNTVRLSGTFAPWHSNIFRGLRELVLDGFRGGYYCLPIQPDGFLQALKSSPSLEVLLVNGVKGSGNSITSSNLDPVTLPSLRSFVLSSADYSLLGLVRIPNCTSTSILCHFFEPAPSESPWAAVIEILRLTPAVDIRLSSRWFSIASQLGVSPHLGVDFPSNPFPQTMLVDLLKEAELSQPLPTAVDISIETPSAVRPILEFLANPTESGSRRLPKLRKVYLKAPDASGVTVTRVILGHEELHSVLRSLPLA